MPTKTKMRAHLCPKCKSKDIELVDYMGIECIVCNNCSYNQRGVYEQYPEERASQKAKSRFTPYKSGGKYRSSKLKGR